VDGSNGVYNLGAIGFPTDSWDSSNYWVDVVFSQNVWLQTTAADFNPGTQSGTTVTNTSGGEIQLAPVLSDDFTGTTLGSAWTSSSWAGAGGGPASVTVSNGILSVSGAQVLSVQPFANTGAEGRVTIGAAAKEVFGLATNLSAAAGNYWAVFTTRGTTGTLYAEVNVAGTLTDVSLGNLPTGYHVYRVQPVSGGFQFSIDGVVKTKISKTFPSGTALHVVMSAFSGSPKPALLVDWVHVLSFATSGVFTSSVFDATRTATWGTAAWTANLPAGTTLTVETSSGNTPTPDGTWSSWAPVVNGGLISSPGPARYLRYRVTLTTSDPSQTPTLYDIAFTWL
jgi:hypothetical protein